MCVQWKTPDDGQRNCPKEVEFYSKNKFEKLVHQVGFIIRSPLYCFFIDILACNYTYDDVFVMMNCLVFCLMTLSFAKIVELKAEFHCTSL